MFFLEKVKWQMISMENREKSNIEEFKMAVHRTVPVNPDAK